MAEPVAIIPRVRGNAIQVGAHWTWELEVLVGPAEPLFLQPKAENPPFLTREAALNDLRAHAVNIVKMICETMGQPAPETLMDLSQGAAFKTEEFAKPTVGGKEVSDGR